MFGAFSRSEVLAEWWGPADFTTPSLEFAPRVGAGYRIEMQPPEGDAFWLVGEFREVDPPRHLAFTFAWEEPDPDDVETLVELSFSEAGQTTEVALRQGSFKTEARRELHRNGWTESFDKLERLLGRSPLRLVEFPADDVERAVAFWRGLLDASLEPRTAEQGEGWQSTSEPAIGVHPRGRGPGDTWSLPYFEVADMEEALATVTELGGAVIHPGEAWSVCKDSEGTPFGLKAR